MLALTHMQRRGTGVPEHGKNTCIIHRHADTDGDRDTDTDTDDGDDVEARHGMQHKSRTANY
jgi:hypothetical protein